MPKTESVRVDAKLLSEVREIAEKDSRTITAVIGLALKQYLGK